MGGGGWEDELKNKTNLSQSLVEVEAELGNFIVCQIRSIFSILHIWSKYKDACKCVKLALKYHTIKRGEFLFNTLYYYEHKDILLSTYLLQMVKIFLFGKKWLKRKSRLC